jgi:uncharacterized protein (DUF1501 family)
MTFSPAMLLSIAPKLAELLKDAVGHYGDLRAAGMTVSPDILAAYLAVRVGAWNPSVAGKTVLDDETRGALCRFLAGVAFNICK